MGGVYIHVPFCASKCPYCDFYSFRSTPAQREQYVDAVIDELTTHRRTSQYLDSSFSADTLYIGGGTPSVLLPEQLEKIIVTASNSFKLSADAEITVECNPASDMENIIPALARAGVNRVSLGMQSAVDSERKILGRHSDKNRIAAVAELLKQRGINNISLDIMLGVPNQTEKSLYETLDFIRSQGVTHISAYILKLEENTPFYNRQNSFSFPDEDEVCSFYDICCDELQSMGFNHYEISNFALPGFESRHNTKYWTLEDYLGIGPAAHSFINGKRFYFKRDIDGFINGEAPEFDCIGGDSEEYIMLSLRLKSGLSMSRLSAKYGDEAADRIIKKTPLLIKQGLLNKADDRIFLTRRGVLVSNSVIAELI